MTFGVMTGGGGLAGWSLLNRTGSRQRELVANDGAVKLAASHYRQTIAEIASADELLSDYRLLNVSLRAFGLQADIGNKAFLRKILDSDLSDKSSLANRLSNKSYRKFAEAFGFGKGESGATTKAGFANKIVAQYVEREFETRVGQADDNLRLALNAQRELSALASGSSTNDTKWYEVLGSTPLRKVFQGAFGFSASYDKLPIDRQLQEYKKAAIKQFGSDDMARFKDGAQVEELIHNFLARSAVQNGPATNRYSNALALLSPR